MNAVQYGAADLPQNLCETMTKCNNLCIITSNKSKELGISSVLGVRVVARSNRVAPIYFLVHSTSGKGRDFRIFVANMILGW